ncbi:hypothetical protein BC937DRAFT_95595 [Endogone sp. FLAS-F59071]|nr:hypothetical protein BC937DRAFT_95595 [Endogone sp. FLAS-F59071]|eukprot:RUS13268.1 hypothetical protein BC937DRAFT_95595 [Endogone sp. FLAS-F59071]
MSGRQMKTVVIRYRRHGFSDQYPEDLSGFLPENVFRSRIQALNGRLKWRHPKYGIPIYLISVMVFFIICGVVFVFVGPFATHSKLQYIAIMASFGASWFIAVVFFVLYVSVASKFKKFGREQCMVYNSRDTQQYNIRWGLVRKNVDAAEADDEIQQGWCIEIRQAQLLRNFTSPVAVVVHEPDAHEESSKGKPMEERGLLAHVE